MIVHQDIPDPELIRKSHMIRQIEEGELGINAQDYDRNGNLDLEGLKRRLSMRSE